MYFFHKDAGLHMICRKAEYVIQMTGFVILYSHPTSVLTLQGCNSSCDQATALKFCGKIFLLLIL